MAQLPALRDPVSPELFGRRHAYGVANDLDRMRQGLAPAPRAPRLPTRRRRPLPGGRVRRWWAGNELRPVDLWLRLLCRTGHHDLQGGRRLRCVRCGAEAGL
jgi:hypothetical protein